LLIVKTIKLKRPTSRLVAPENLMGFKEVMDYLGVSHTTIRNYLNPEKRPEYSKIFPKPIAYLAATPVWDRREIEAFKRHEEKKKSKKAKGGGKLR